MNYNVLFWKYKQGNLVVVIELIIKRGWTMSIKKIRVTNFKSFKDLEVELGNFNVLIGANASGKSNFVQIFKFLSDMANLGLDNAISMQGGVEYLGNINVGNSEKFSLRVVLDRKFRQLIKKNNKG